MNSIKYFTSRFCSSENEITYEEAQEMDYYVVCHIENNYPRFAELVEEDQVVHVIYYDRKWPNAEVIKTHLSHYPGITCEFFQKISHDGRQIDRRWIIATTGKLSMILDTYLNLKGDPIREERLDIDKTLLEFAEYEYDNDGNLIFLREYTSDGILMSEYNLEEPGSF